MILPDTSAWIEFLRGTGSAIDRQMTALVRGYEEVWISEVVVMELLAGERSPDEVTATRSMLMEYPVIPLRGVTDFEEAARLYRVCRSAGEALRGLADCLIAVPAIRSGASILHMNRDFDAIARHADLRIEQVA
jgi:predicted nucleic acid-binding protein